MGAVVRWRSDRKKTFLARLDGQFGDLAGPVRPRAFDQHLEPDRIAPLGSGPQHPGATSGRRLRFGLGRGRPIFG